MSRRFHRASFHRRILPWVFIAIFLIMAPAVVFYTAGYRYNPKKGVIERNGTLIIDSLPKGATIQLNGYTVPEKTPVTLQNVAPGTYAIRVHQSGYSSWEKTLDVKPERVTFANHIRLWKESAPKLLVSGNVRAIQASQSGRYLAAVTGEATSTLLLYDLSNASSESMPFPGLASTTQVELVWNDAETSVLVKGRSGEAFLAVRGGPVAALQTGAYRWDGGTLNGALPGETFLYTVSSGEIQRSPFPAGIVDEQSGYRLIQRNIGLALIETRKPERIFELPTGDWHFIGRLAGILFISDGSRWLGIDTEEAIRDGVFFPSEGMPSILQKSGDTIAVSSAGGELWMTTIGKQTELLLRTSQAITGSVWHRLGEQVFYSTLGKVRALDLDSRDGRGDITLADFERISGLTIARNVLYIAGRRSGEEGIYRLEVE